MRIAFVRSVDIRQAFPTYLSALTRLRDAGHEVTTIVVDDVEPPQEIGDCVVLPGDAGPRVISEVLTDWKPDRVVSISVPDDKALRDSLAFAHLAESLPDVVAVHHPYEATYVLSDKWETRLVAQQVGISTARGILIRGDLIQHRGVNYQAYLDLIRRRLAALSFPVIAKPVWDSMAQGIVTYADADHLLAALTDQPPTNDLLVEEYLDGQLFGIEVLGSNGDYRFQPLIRKATGTVDDFVPFNHIRFGPVADPSGHPDELTEKLVKLARMLRLEGSFEAELIWADGRFHLIEINPRISGLANLSVAISGVNAYRALAVGSAEEEHPARFVAEVPLDGDLTPEAASALSAAADVLSVESVTYHDGTVQTKVLLTALSLTDALQRTEQLEAQRLVDSRVVQEFRAAVASPGQQDLTGELSTVVDQAS